jgi:hypothetical protein
MKSVLAFMMSFVTCSLLPGAVRAQNCTPRLVTEMALILNKESVLEVIQRLLNNKCYIFL